MLKGKLRHMTRGISPPDSQQLDIIQRLAKGETMPEIAQVIGVSRSTIRRHVNAAIKSAGAKNTIQLVAICAYRKWVEPFSSSDDKTLYEDLVVHEIPDWMVKLSKQEKEVVWLVGEGKTNRQIAKKLFIQQNTVRVHLRSIYKELDLQGEPEKKRETLKDAVSSWRSKSAANDS